MLMTGDGAESQQTEQSPCHAKRRGREPNDGVEGTLENPFSG